VCVHRYRRRRAGCDGSQDAAIVPIDRRAPRAISAANAYVMTDMMSDVIQRGTAQLAKSLGRRDLAGKTGTTSDRRDAWFVGFNADIVAAAWIGFDQERPLGDNEEGGQHGIADVDLFHGAGAARPR
jgi:penicillin-binding protein 1A